MMALLPLLLLAVLCFLLVALSALRNHSRARFEKFCLERESDLYQAVLMRGDGAIMAVRNTVWLILLAFLLSLAYVLLDRYTSDPAAKSFSVSFGWVALWSSLAWIGVLLTEIAVFRPIARVFAEPILYRTWFLLDVVRLVMQPILRVERAVTHALERVSGLDRVRLPEYHEEVLTVLSEATRDGAIQPDTLDMIEGLLELHGRTVSDIMTPRTDMVMLAWNDSHEEARRSIVECGHSRLPVFKENRDDVRGVLYAKDLLPYTPGAANMPRDLSGIKLRKPIFVPENKPVDVLLKEFQRKRIHIAIVLDEYGGVAGLVTIEDILEEIVGDIADEYDTEEEPVVRVIEEGHSWEVDARLHVDELNEEAPQLKIPEDEDFDTLGGFLFSSLGHVPAVGDCLDYGPARYTVIAASDRVIRRVRVEIVHPSGQTNGNNGPPNGQEASPG